MMMQPDVGEGKLNNGGAYTEQAELNRTAAEEMFEIPN